MSILENGKSYLYQWDINQRVILDSYPELTEVHIYLQRPGYYAKAKPEDRESLRVIPYREDGHVYADIPNDLLLFYGDLHLYLCVIGNGRFETIARKLIKIRHREKPASYIYSDNYSVDLTWGDLTGSDEKNV